MGTTENTSFENIGNGANEIYIQFQDLNAGTNYFANISKDDSNFYELLEIISKYDYEQPEDGPEILSDHYIGWDDYNTEYLLIVQVYNDFDRDVILLTDTGDLTRNKHCYIMPNSRNLIDEFIEYKNNNDVFHPGDYFTDHDKDFYKNEFYQNDDQTGERTHYVGVS